MLYPHGSIKRNERTIKVTTEQSWRINSRDEFNANNERKRETLIHRETLRLIMYALRERGTRRC